MGFLSIIFGLAIILAVLFQTVLKDKATDGSTDEVKTQTTKAFEALKDAEQLKATMNSQQQDMGYEEQMKNH